ncbi:hypothetical protein [Halolactibacillus sp. JCM 19043]|uniref:hypothetical protein n=1 Tax=Halolactibacillus sp. JCM 19043 TaxID=1460638 RepID=UPI000ADC2D24|nr:hypothetical protein [Halolactibacillus sp. JCM 19043]
MLIIDSEPYFDSLEDRYLENCRSDSDAILIKKAQKIEQGLGRSVRGEKDYSAIILIGTDLIKLIRSKKSRNQFSTQTQTQIDIGFEIATYAQEEIKSGKPPIKALIGLLNQLITRDDGWKQFYTQKMDSMILNGSDDKVLDMFAAEKSALDEYMIGNYNQAAKIIQKLIDKHVSSSEERGWYLQEMAKYTYPFSKSESNTLQIAAHRTNRYLLKPKEGMEFQKIDKISWKRVESIKKQIEKYTSYEDLLVDLNAVLDSLRFGVNADTFENSFNELGQFLGFLSERPDKEWKEGPDNLWMLGNNEYLIAECKNQVELSRNEINKDESGQMNNASSWFTRNYGDVSVTRVLIIPTKKLSRAAGFNDEVKIMRDSSLKKLVRNVRDFYSEFKTADLGSLSKEQIQSHINTHKLSIKDLTSDYYESPKEY